MHKVFYELQNNEGSEITALSLIVFLEGVAW